MPCIAVHEAIGQALAEEMRRDARVLMFGEGVATKRPELVAEFGAARVRNTPLAEAIIAGTAVGAAATGLRPVVDLLFAPFLCYAMDALVNSAGKLRQLSGGQCEFPLVAIAMTGAGWGVGSQHNHNVEAWFAHAPGLKVVMPSTAADFKGLLKSAIRDDNPVLFFVDLGLLQATGEVPEHETLVPLGQAAVVREGRDVTLVSYAKTVPVCLQAADQLAAEGFAAEVIDLRSIKPLDAASVLESAQRTGRVLVVHEASRSFGVGAEVAALVAEHAFGRLKAPVRRLGVPGVPIPYSRPLEQAVIPSVERIAEQCIKAMESRVGVPA